jgi:hypothetical protein
MIKPGIHFKSAGFLLRMTSSTSINFFWGMSTLIAEFSGLKYSIAR